MKKFFTFFWAVCLTLAGHATQYCQTAVTSNDGNSTIYLSCEKLAPTSYRITIEGDGVTGLGGSFFHPGAQSLQSTVVSNQDGKIVCMIEAASDPNFYTPLYVIMGGEKVFTFPTDVTWGRCGNEEEDKEAPILSIAELVSVTHNTAVIYVSASDNVGIAYYTVMSGEDFVGTFWEKDSQITIKGLRSNTTYSFTIAAVDPAANSSNTKTVTLTTEEFHYCDAPAGHDGNPEFGDPNGRILLTLEAIAANVLKVTVKPNVAAGATKKLDYLYVDPKFGTPITAGADQTDVEGEDEMSVEVTYPDGFPSTLNLTIQWSHPNWDGRWACNLQDIATTELCGSSLATVVNNNTAKKSVKFFENGQIYFRLDGQVYDTFGRIVK